MGNFIEGSKSQYIGGIVCVILTSIAITFGLIYGLVAMTKGQEVLGRCEGEDICFMLGDNSMCRGNYQEISTMTEEAKYQGESDVQDLEGLYDDILLHMQSNGINLVDNTAYLDWCKTYIDPQCTGQRCGAVEGEVMTFSREVNQKFYSASGAESITNAQELEEALVIMYWWRAEYGVEDSAQLDPLIMPSLNSCTPATMATGEKLWEDYSEYSVAGIDLTNYETFLTATDDWITDPP